jgi:large subunit ribosomal protein L9
MSKSNIDVILLHNLKKKGKFGDTVSVKRGYARNFLVPQKIAIYASEKNKKVFDDIKNDMLLKSNTLKEKALKTIDQIKDLKISIIRNAGQDGKIFGTVSSFDIFHALRSNNVEIERSKILVQNTIKYTGQHKILLDLHPEVLFEKEIFVITDSSSVPSKVSNEEEVNEAVEKDLSFEEDEVNDEKSNNLSSSENEEDYGDLDF